MDKNEVNRILHQIRNKCLYANGGSCELEYKTIRWRELYRSKKSFFKYRWELTASCSNYDKEQMQECELTLKRLPKGLTFAKNTVLDNDELQSIEPHKEYMSASKWYKTIYTIKVSEAYSQNILNSLGRSRAFIEQAIPSDVEAKIYDFKRKVLSLYPNLVKDMYAAFEIGNYCVCRSGIGVYEGDGCINVKVHFSDYKLKPLSEEYQCLGLALAIAEQGSRYLKATELFRINNASFGAFIYKIDTAPKDINDGLNEW